MPFDNVLSEEAERLGQLLRSDALRPRKRRARLSSASEGHEHDGKEEEGGEREQRQLSHSTDPQYFDQMSYVDRVMAVLERVQHRFALTQGRREGEQSRVECEAVKDPVERPLPFPSLFLQSPAEFVKHSWVTGRTPAERCADAASLSTRRPPPPPRALLSDTAPLPGSGHPTKADRIAAATHMYTLDTVKDKQAANRVVTVLQAEVGLAIAVDYTASSHDQRDRTENDVFLMSTDATSCVLLACRVSLHPRWREAAVGPSPEREAAQSPLSPKERFLSQVLSTHTAAMAHLDRTDGIEAVLRQLVWEGAVPAWLHTVGQLFAHTYGGACQPSSSAVSDVAAAVDELRRCLGGGCDHAEPCQAAPLLQVEWYIVGGIREKKNTAPMLTKVFQAFFPFQGGEEEEEEEEKAEEEEPLLATDLPLSTLIAAEKEDAAGALVVTLAHRLREDALCVWAFNTCLRSWARDHNPKNLYAFPVCYGLLLNVSSGVSWPCQMQPGRRACTLGCVRPLFSSKYHAIFPLEHEKHEEEKEDYSKGPSASSSLLEVYRQLIQVGEALSQRWAQGHATERLAEASAAAAQSYPLTLSLFVAECLSVLRHQQQQQQQQQPSLSSTTTTTNDVGVAAETITFPFFFRTRLPDLWRRSYRAPDAIPLTDLPEDAFLSCSTTPHCEPADFCELTRQNYLCMTVVGPRDVYEAFGGRACGGHSTAAASSSEEETPFPVDGVLFVSL